MKKLLLVLLIGIAGIGLVACDITQEIPEDDIIVEETPGEDDNKEETPGEDTEPEIDEEDKEPEIDEEDKEPEIDEEDEEDEGVVYEDIVVDESNLTRGEFKTVTLDVKGYRQIKITISGTSDYDIPVNINNFKVDGEEAEYEGVTGTPYLFGHEFKIGELSAIGELVNTHTGDLRLHTRQSDIIKEHYIIVNVEDISEFEFQYRVTTAAYEYIDSLNIEMAAMEPEIIEEDEEPVIDEDKEPIVDEEEPIVDEEEPIVDEEEPIVDEEDKEPEIIEEDENIVYEDRMFIDESNLDKDTFKTVILDVKGYSQIKITISGTGSSDIPVSIDNFKVDGEEVEYEGVSGSAYLLDHEFKIGELDAVGRLINIYSKEFRLHTTHKDHGKEHYIIVNVENISEFEFQYKVTNNAYTRIDSLNIEMTAIEQE